MKKLTLILLSIILIGAGFVRFYKLDKVPPSLNWDEIAGGYNAYTIAHWGMDEYGNKFPIVFRSFGDDKHPIHIYLTAPIVGIFGLSDFSTRAGSAAIGILSVAAIFFLSRYLFQNEGAALFSALFMAVSPYAIHYSRGLWEANFALFFLIAGCAAFLAGVRKGNWLISLSFFFWGLSFFSYHSAKIVVPLVALYLSITHVKELLKNKKILIFSIIITLIFAGLIIKEPRILGFARINQTKFSEETLNKYGGELGTVLHNYKSYFTYSYLFQKGDQTPRGSVKVIGQFYKIDLVLLLIGIISLLIHRQWKVLGLVSIWLLASPIPGAVSTLEPGATRAIFMLAPVLLLSGMGAGELVAIVRKGWVKWIMAVLILILLSIEVTHYLIYYFNEYPKKEAIEWQYGMKDAVLFAKRHTEYSRVYVDKIRQQPYIFFLFYLKTPLPTFLKTVKYDTTEAKSYNTVASFGRYNFGNWNPIESYPSPDILYIITPSYYSGLRFISSFDVKKLIKYPNGTDAFYLVSGNW